MPQQKKIFRTIYRIGALGGTNFGHVILKSDGTVGFYQHPNEVRFDFDGTTLSFINTAGNITSQLRYSLEANCFLGKMPSDLYLLPILELPFEQSNDSPNLPAILINSIPKSGTYFLEAACTEMGVRALRLHLSSQFSHNYREISAEEMHHNPNQLVVPSPAGAIAHLLCAGEQVVGHIDDHSQLDEFIKAGVTVLHCTRDLRDVLVSLYHFKRSKVAPVSPADTAWRKLGLSSGFIAFLCYFAEKDILLIKRTAEIILERSESIIRFEDAINGQVTAQLPPGFTTTNLSSARST